MPALTNVIVCAVAATLFLTALGLPLARLTIPGRTLALAAAPLLGWAVFNALALPILTLFGFTFVAVAIVAAAALVAGLSIVARSRGAAQRSAADPAALSWWSIGAAALLAILPAMAILPKFTGDGVVLAEQMYDHSKIAIIDDIVRLGLPAGNPFFAGEPPRLPYYYLWHFGAAVFAKGLGISGWEADAASTWFTAFASLMLMMGLAVRLGGRSAAALWVVLLSATLSLRPVLSLALGRGLYGRLLSQYPGLPGWMTQSSWSPQHLAAAGCVVLAVLLIARLAHDRSRMAMPVLALVVVAGFESSTWIGGIVFAIVAGPIGLAVLRCTAPEDRPRFIRRAVIAALLAAAIAAPFLRDQYLAIAARHAGAPIGFHPYEVLGPLVPDTLQRILDIPAFWLVLLVVEFPAIYVLGSIALARAVFAPRDDAGDKMLVVGLAISAALCFGISWLLISTILNNDLGWRAVLPGLLVLTAFAAATLARWFAAPAWRRGAAALVLVALGIPDAVKTVSANATGLRTASAAAFAETPELWSAVRRHSAPDERIANNPLFLADMVRWPINVSWALLADRRSCYAGWDLARVFAAEPGAQIDALEISFERVFAGAASAEEVSVLARRYDCRLVVLTPSDGAWTNDGFARSPDYRLVEERPDRWRLYRATDAVTAPP